MLDAYADYLRALVGPAASARRDTRNAARTERVNAQASIERMRSEPATPPALLALARALFANGNRLARTAMTLEAMLDDLAELPAEAGIRDFIDPCADALQSVAATLRSGRVLPALPDLRALQRQLADRVRDSADASVTDLLGRISDRLVDNIDTLAHVARRDPPRTIADGNALPT
jgi:hypothetical protein